MQSGSWQGMGQNRIRLQRHRLIQSAPLALAQGSLRLQLGQGFPSPGWQIGWCGSQATSEEQEAIHEPALPVVRPAFS